MVTNVRSKAAPSYIVIVERAGPAPPAGGRAMLLLLLLLFTAASASSAAAAAACSDDFDCSLAGACVSGTCHCQAWTKGPSCAALNLTPLASPGKFQGTLP